MPFGLVVEVEGGTTVVVMFGDDVVVEVEGAKVVVVEEVIGFSVVVVVVVEVIGFLVVVVVVGVVVEVVGFAVEVVEEEVGSMVLVVDAFEGSGSGTSCEYFIFSSTSITWATATKATANTRVTKVFNKAILSEMCDRRIGLEWMCVWRTDENRELVYSKRNETRQSQQ